MIIGTEMGTGVRVFQLGLARSEKYFGAEKYDPDEKLWSQQAIRDQVS